jgi:hypothetical protein
MCVNSPIFGNHCQNMSLYVSRPPLLLRLRFVCNTNDAKTSHAFCAIVMVPKHGRDNIVCMKKVGAPPLEREGPGE